MNRSRALNIIRIVVAVFFFLVSCIYILSFLFPSTAHKILLNLGLAGLLGPHSALLTMALLALLVAVFMLLLPKVFSGIISYYRRNFREPGDDMTPNSPLNTTYDPVADITKADVIHAEQLAQYERDKVRFKWQQTDRKIKLATSLFAAAVILILGLLIYTRLGVLIELLNEFIG